MLLNVRVLEAVLHTFTLTLLFTLTGNLYVSNCELYCSRELSQGKGCFTYVYSDWVIMWVNVSCAALVS